MAPVARPPRGPSGDPSRGRAGSGSWQWARTAQTQRDAQQQAAVAMAIKNAREMALLPYANRVTTQRGGGREDRPDRPPIHLAAPLLATPSAAWIVQTHALPQATAAVPQKACRQFGPEVPEAVNDALT